MEKDVALSKDRMLELKSLGIDIDKASMVWHPVMSKSETFTLKDNTIYQSKEFWSDPKRQKIAGTDFWERHHGRDVPAFTANDILNILPVKICFGATTYALNIGIASDKSDERCFYLNYRDTETGGALRQVVDKTLLDVLFIALVWCIKIGIRIPATVATIDEIKK